MPEAPVVDVETVVRVREYLGGIGARGLDVLSAPDVVIAAGNALLQDDVYIGPEWSGAELARMRARRNAEGDDLPFWQRASQTVYNRAVRRLLGRNVLDFRSGELATRVRERHTAEPGSDGAAFERLLGTAFIAAVSAQQGPLLEERPEAQSGGLWQPGAPRRILAGGRLEVAMSYAPGDALGVNLAFSRMLSAIDATSRGMWEHFVLVTGSEFVASTTQALAERVGAAGRIAVRLGNTSDVVTDASAQGRERFQLVEVDASAATPQDGRALSVAASSLLEPGGVYVVTAESPRSADIPEGARSVFSAAEEVFFGRSMHYGESGRDASGQIAYSTETAVYGKPHPEYIV